MSQPIPVVDDLPDWPDGRGLPGDPLAALVVAARLIGGCRGLVAAPGEGNVSVKMPRDGDGGSTLWVKGSGRDLATLGKSDLAPLDLTATQGLLDVAPLAQEELRRALAATALDPAAPPPSIETLMHALLPHRVLLHCHPRAVLALTATPAGRALARERWGDEAAFVPWAEPGHELARSASALLATLSVPPRVVVLLEHGVFVGAPEAPAAWAGLCRMTTEALRLWHELPTEQRGSARSRE